MIDFKGEIALFCYLKLLKIASNILLYVAFVSCFLLSLAHFYLQPSSLSFLHSLMGFTVAASLPSVSQSIWPHFLPVGPPPRAEAHLRRHRMLTSSAVVMEIRL